MKYTKFTRHELAVIRYEIENAFSGKVDGWRFGVDERYGAYTLILKSGKGTRTIIFDIRRFEYLDVWKVRSQMIKLIDRINKERK